MTEYVVVAAAIRRDDFVLAAERAYPADLVGRWELPGGKVEPGESDETALRRECREELGVDVVVGDRVGPEVRTHDGRGVVRTYFVVLNDDVQPAATEHRQLRWLARSELHDVDWLDADRPIIDAIAAILPP